MRRVRLRPRGDAMASLHLVVGSGPPFAMSV
jgi:hypothetical protein